ncbi:beta-lactamase family protein [Annulohypoxylon truncatum]|uniref:beta-lactamase family protein n=1 Tax=Annulohypoxylon truncatum TaxID=327061 RepID=UPI0020081A63|nr:beta-lactamase family protein [Annulohypoxylon truncatum]KAI1210671.1 beta-lactamase family protein [Annulohypoxylon truncatum]
MAEYSHESAFKAACEDDRLPGVALVAADATGKFKYEKAFGENAHGETIATDSVMWIASCTKLMTSVAAMQQVEQGKIDLDEDVERVLPELGALKVLTRFDSEGKPEYEERQGKITLRHLLTHSSGLSAPIFSPKLQQLAQFRGPPEEPPHTIVDEYSEPLVFQPGTGWQYGTGLDWAGQIVERLSGLSLEEYMRANIWGPLDMQHVSFFPDSIPEMKARKIGMSRKDENGKLVPMHNFTNMFSERKDIYGGGAGFGNAVSYVKLLQSLCANDGRVLKKETVEEMFRPQLSPEAKTSLNEMIKADEVYRRVGANSFDMNHQILDYGLGGEIGTRDEVGRRKAGTMSWGGMPNLIWWIDREAGLCGALFTNSLPMGDEQVSKLMAEFERAVYKQFEKFKKQ